MRYTGEQRGVGANVGQEDNTSMCSNGWVVTRPSTSGPQIGEQDVLSDTGGGGIVRMTKDSGSLSSIPKKGYCSVCGFVVLLDGHAKRCRVPLDSKGLKQLAWIGDAAWSLFVRTALVRQGEGITDVQKYTTNEVLAGLLYKATTRLSYEIPLPLNANDHTKATYLEAAFAVSAYVRVSLADEFRLSTFRPANLSLWEPRYDTEHLLVDTFKPQPSLDGYCYLNFFPIDEHRMVANTMGLYPTWREVKQMLPKQTYVDIWVKVERDICHVTDKSLPGMVRFSGFVEQLPLDPTVMMGGLKKVNLTDRILLNSTPIIADEKLRADFVALAVLNARFKANNKIVLINRSKWYRLHSLITGERYDVTRMRSFVALLLTQVGTATAMIHTNSYIAVSGGMSVMEQTEAYSLGYVVDHEIDTTFDSDFTDSDYFSD